MASRRPFKPAEPTFPTPSSTISSPRSNSPAPSSSSSSSSLSTTSTHTVVPLNRSALSALTEIPSSLSSSSVSSDETATPRASPASLPNGSASNSSTTKHRTSRPHSQTRRLSSSAGSGHNPLPRSNLAHQVSARPASPSMYALIRASLAPYLTSTRITTFLILFVLIPLISFVLRMRRRKRLLQVGLEGGTTAASIAAAVSASSNADLVRRRLQAASGVAEGGLMQRAWGEIVRVVGDTVRMAASGLVWCIVVLYLCPFPTCSYLEGDSDLWFFFSLYIFFTLIPNGPSRSIIWVMIMANVEPIRGWLLYQ